MTGARHGEVHSLLDVLLQQAGQKLAQVELFMCGLLTLPACNDYDRSPIDLDFCRGKQRCCQRDGR